MKSVNYAILYLIVFMLCLGTAGCSAPQSDRLSVLAPRSDAVIYSKSNVKLYFRFQGEPFLAGETRVIDERLSERLEETILDELIAGPSMGNYDLEALIHPATKVVAIEEKSSVLYVTLSREFLLHPNSSPQGWAEDILQKDEAATRRMLAIDSIVDTLAGLGSYTKIQILIDEDNTGSGSRPIMAIENEIGGTTYPLEAMSFNSDNILTPATTAKVIMQAVNERNWKRLYKFLSSKDSNQQPKPIFETAAAQMHALNELYKHSVQDVIIQSNGESAMVFVNLFLAGPNGGQIEQNGVPLKMIQENEIWKIGLDILTQHFIVGVEGAQ